MHDSESPGAEKSGIGNLIESAVSKDRDQGLVVCDHQQVITTLGEEAGLFKALSYSQHLSFDRCIA